MQLEDWRKTCLLSDGNSKINKAHLAVTWQADGYVFEWEWTSYRDQVRFKFDKDSPWAVSKCYDDVYRAMKDLK